MPSDQTGSQIDHQSQETSTKVMASTPQPSELRQPWKTHKVVSESENYDTEADVVSLEQKGLMVDATSGSLAA